MTRKLGWLGPGAAAADATIFGSLAIATAVTMLVINPAFAASRIAGATFPYPVRGKSASPAA